jgi:predicted nucleic acid-binding protein
VTIYADTSFFIALRFADDAHHVAACNCLAEKEEDIFLWSPWHRLEVNNTFRQLSMGENPPLNEAEARRIIRRLESDVRLGYFLHMEADWRDVLRTGNEISADHGFTIACRAADLCHVAYALELAAELFVTFDSDQAQLAREAGIRTVIPAE